jgi:chromosome segregation ATPase
MDEPRPTTTEFHRDLRTVLYNLGEKYGVTGFEAVGVLSYLAAEVNADNLAADGLLARGPGLQDQEPTEPEPATATDQPTSAAAYIAELEATVAELQSDYRTLDRGCERMTKKATELGERVAFLAEENDRLTAAADQPTSAAAYIAELEDTVKHLRVMRDSLINSGISKTELCEKQAQRIAELEAAYHTLDRDFTLMGQERVELGDKVYALARENTRLTAELADARK